LPEVDNFSRTERDTLNQKLSKTYLTGQANPKSSKSLSEMSS